MTLGLNYLPAEKIGAIPPRFAARHEFCFYLHDLILHLLVEVENLQIRSGKFEISRSDQAIVQDQFEDFLDYLLKSDHRTQASRMLLNHVMVALVSDFLSFVYEGLIALSKRKFSVGFSLLRKPFKENLLHLSWMLADTAEYFEKFESSPATLMESRKTDQVARVKIIECAIENCFIKDVFNAELLEKIIYDKNYDAGLASLFDKATHLVTGARAIRTEPLNLNFIFKDPRDNDIFESTYSSISLILMYAFAILSSELEKITPIDTSYVRRRLLIAFMVYQSLFLKGPPKVYKTLEKALGGLVKCPVCKSRYKAKKAAVPRLLISERFVCPDCSSDVSFPILWLMGQADIDWL